MSLTVFAMVLDRHMNEFTFSDLLSLRASCKSLSRAVCLSFVRLQESGKFSNELILQLGLAEETRVGLRVFLRCRMVRSRKSLSEYRPFVVRTISSKNEINSEAVPELYAENPRAFLSWSDFCAELGSSTAVVRAISRKDTQSVQLWSDENVKTSCAALFVLYVNTNAPYAAILRS